MGSCSSCAGQDASHGQGVLREKSGQNLGFSRIDSVRMSPSMPDTSPQAILILSLHVQVDTVQRAFL